jgi:hypothetical protein
MAAQVFRRAFGLCKDRRFLVPEIALAVVVGLLSNGFQTSEPARPDFYAAGSVFLRLMLLLGVSVLAMWPGWSMLSLGIALARGEDATLSTRWIPFGLYLRLLLVQLVYGLAMCVGFVLLFVPGIYVAVLWSQAAPLMVDGRAEFLDALGASKDLTEGLKSDIFATFLCWFLVTAVVLGCSFAIFGLPSSQITLPFTWTRAVLRTLWNLPVAVFSAALFPALYVEVAAAQHHADVSTRDFLRPVAGPQADAPS